MTKQVLGAVILLVAGTGSARADVPVQPGQWEIVTTVESIDMPGAPPAVTQMMRGKPTTIRTCVTPEQAAQGPQAIQKADKSCSVTRATFAGGKYVSEVVCRRPSGTMTSSSTGTYSPTAFTAKSQSKGTGQLTMAMTATASGHRIGPCK